ncbi:hypothetical protein DFP72DRAFT_851857 [Ephemerocybe angulata]|uniref:Uncharacterized protein n=1 Tax=Ephemerocybe angulata TaxID=980116 RepID=A0A8H6HQX0_9AGAR|nr:hypothetical protein DFP72DRAFT_851857 [Tulosesus angulatus]
MRAMFVAATECRLIKPQRHSLAQDLQLTKSRIRRVSSADASTSHQIQQPWKVSVPSSVLSSPVPPPPPSPSVYATFALAAPFDDVQFDIPSDSSNYAAYSLLHSFLFTSNPDPSTPSEKGNVQTQDRHVFCTRCRQYVNHRNDLGNTPMSKHRTSAKCKAGFLDRLLRRYTSLESHLPPAQPEPVPVSEASTCSGATFNWTIGSPFLTYPFAIHDPSHRSPGYDIISIDPIASTLLIRSHSCTGASISPQIPTCRFCQESATHITKVQSRSVRVVDTKTKLRRNQASNWHKGGPVFRIQH